MDEDPVERFARNIGIEPQNIAFLHECPHEIQSSVISNFNASGSKDGNVLGRLQGYVRHTMRRSGMAPPESLGLAAKDRPEYAAGAVHTFLAPGAGGAIGLSQVGGGCPALPEFSRRVGLTAAAEQFLARLPQEVLASVLSGFDPSGTKDGNVWGRLLGYTRSHWARHLHVDQESSSYIRSLPEETQLIVMMEFDPRGSKDGNVGGRLAQFIDQLQHRGDPAADLSSLTAAMPGALAAPGGMNAMLGPSAGMLGGMPGAMGMMPQVPAWNFGYQAQMDQQLAHLAMLQQLQAPPLMGAAPAHHVFSGQHSAGSTQHSEAVLEFAQRMRLDTQAQTFMLNLKTEVANTVITKFDPSGTKDGNVWGRLLGYIRHQWCRFHNADQATVDRLRSMPELEQMRALQDPAANGMQMREQAMPAQQTFFAAAPPMATFGGTASMPQFVSQWGLNSNAEAFLSALPDAVRDAVIVGFDGGGTKDGNVWGRLLGFARIQWMKSLGLDSSMTMQLKSLPEEAQMLCMTSFDPRSSKDGNLTGRLQAFMNKCLRQSGYEEGAPPSHIVAGGLAGGSSATGGLDAESLAKDPMVLAFLERCGLDMPAVEYLQHLPDDMLQQVMDNFDPSGTKDGNVLGRLQGYVKFLARKRGLPVDADGVPTKRYRA